MTTRVSLLARILIEISLCSYEAEYETGSERIPGLSRPWSSLLLVKCLVDDVRQRGVAVEDVYVEPFILQGAHGVEAFLLARPATAHPYPHVLELAVRLCLASAVDDPAKGLFHIGKIRDRPADDDVPDSRQGTDFLGQHFDGPIGGVAGIFSVIGQLAAARNNRVRVIHAGAASGRKHRRVATGNLDEFHRALDLAVDGHDVHFIFAVGPAEFSRKLKIPIWMAELRIAVEQRHGIERHQFAIAFPDDDWVHFQILRVFVVEAGKHFTGKVGHLFEERTGKTSVLGQLLQRLRRRLLPDIETQALYAVPIRFDFDASAIGHKNFAALAGGFHCAIILFLVRDHFGDDDLRDGDAANLTADHLFGGSNSGIQIEANLDETELEARTERLVSLDHQFRMLHPVIGLTEFGEFVC